MRRYLALVALAVGGLLLTPGAVGVPDVPGDPTPPVVTPNISGTLGLNGWYVTNTTVSWSIVDPESIILSTSGCDTRTFSADSTGVTLTCSAESDGGITTISKMFKVDKTAPTGTATPGRGADANGWYNHALTVGFTWDDATSGLASCPSAKTYSGPDSSTASVSASCQDNAGNTKNVPFPLKYDATAPQNNGATASRAPDSNGWYNHALTVGFAGSDATSGIDSCSSVTYSGPDDPSTSVSGTCHDVAGNASAAGAFTLSYDETAPVVTAKSASRPPDVNGWYNHALTVTYAGSDATSGVESCTQTTYSGPDNGAASVPGSCRDRAGNQSAASTLTFAYDGTKPGVTVSPSRVADANGWYNRSLSVSFAGTDATSGMGSCVAPKTYAGPDDAAATVAGTCTDVAGNVGNGSFALKYDQTAPSVTVAPSRSTDANGWYNRDLGVTFAGSDATSGIGSCTAPQIYSGPDTATAVVSGSCSDNAGNATSRQLAFKYDETAPQVTASPSRSADAHGWYNHALTVAFAGSDATSQLASCDAAKSYAGPDNANASVSGSCTDNAGNTGTRSLALKYDSTEPQASASPSRPPDANGWHNHALAINFSGSDATSGIASCDAPKSYSGPDTTSAVFTGTCVDVAGNDREASLTVKYDATAPGVTATPSRAADANGWYNHALTVAFAGTDATSGVGSCVAAKTYSAPDSETASVSGSCTDVAGNSGSQALGFKYDQTPPQVTGSTPSRAADANGWYNHALTVGFQGSDATSGIDSCTQAAYSGPDSAAASVPGSCRDKAANQSAASTFALKYDATPPVMAQPAPSRAPDANGWYNHGLTVAFSGDDATSKLDSCAPPQAYSGPDRVNASVGGTCRDLAGNVAARSFAFGYDATAPANVKGEPARPPDANGWYNDVVTVDFTGDDPTSGIDACTKLTYGGPDTAGASATGSCRDRAGNTSSTATFGFKYDATDPVVTGATAVRAPDQAGWYNRPVAFAVQGSDVTAGIASCPAAIYDGPDGQAASVTAACVDGAGNRAERPFPLSYDANGPRVDVHPTREPDAGDWYNHALDLSFSGTDSVSGLASCQAPERYEGPDNALAVVGGTCLDKAGNVGVGSLPLRYDATAPQLVGARADRPPDANGWYNRPVTVDFLGADEISTIDTCTRAQYSGPDAASTALNGFCRDRAGNQSPPGAFQLKFDGTAPSLSEVKIAVGDKRAVVTWSASPDTSLVQIDRYAGRARVAQTVYRGNARSFTDTRLTNGVRYRYELTAYDEAGNAAKASAAALPTGPLYGPPAGAEVTGPPLLAWKRVPNATYYNVQVWRVRRIFSAWPARTSIRLPRTWTYHGKRYRLTPGRYRWHVWPGFGRPSAKRYGAKLGASTFVVVAPKRVTR